MEKIKIENLTFTYPDKIAPAIEDINISIASGEFICLFGKSGCGKSTLLRQLKPILAPHGEKKGKVFYNNRNISDFTQREQTEKIGFVMQNPDDAIVCDKVWHELAFGLENLSYPAREIRARVAEMACFFGIQDWYYRNIDELSGGQKQLLNLASVMVMQPDVLILDEPTSQLDPISAQDFLDTLSRINKELGTTVIISEHRLEQVLPLADRVIVMDSGKIIADGDVCSAGKALKEQNSDMLLSLPTPMRVYYSLDNCEPCPVTVRDGREWLSKVPIKKDISFAEAESYSNNDPILKVDDVWFKYEKNSPDILKGLSLKIYENEFYAIVGGNGAGKTTALSVISGINAPYRGKIKIIDGKKIVALPQNPQNLFVKKTVLLDLYEALENNKDNKETKEEKLQNVINFCELENLLKSHPFDLSGGEQQRVALAKVLLCEPDILFLDEPTKGLDSHFKKKLADMLKGLQKNGVTIIMVSHDIEFSAKCADRLGMFFDGQVISEDTPRAFFAGKNFYTTSANRMARNIRSDAVLDEDIIAMLGGKQYNINIDIDRYSFKKTAKEKPEQSKKAKKLTPLNIILGIVFAILFGITAYFTKNDYTVESYTMQALGILFLALALYNLIPRRESRVIKITSPQVEISKRTLLMALIVLFMIPLTIFIGTRYLGGRKYYFISSMIILETMLPFILIFEGRKPQARELVILSMLSAIAVAGRIAFAMLPQFKPVIALVIISGVCFGGEAGFLVGAVTAFVSNFYFMQGVWTPWQMFAFGIIGFLAGILFKKRSVGKIKLSIFGFLVTLIVYGGIMNPASVIMYQENITADMIWTSFIGGFLPDLIHATSTAFFLWFTAEPITEKLERVKIKYGLNK